MRPGFDFRARQVRNVSICANGMESVVCGDDLYLNRCKIGSNLKVNKNPESYSIKKYIFKDVIQILQSNVILETRHTLESNLDTLHAGSKRFLLNPLSQSC